MKQNNNDSVASAIYEPIFETDRAFRLIYPVHSAPVDLRDVIEVDLIALETLAAQYDAPHFKIQNFERVDAFGRQEMKGWNLHFTHIANSGLVIAYEKTKDKEPCAAVLARENAGGAEA